MPCGAEARVRLRISSTKDLDDEVDEHDHIDIHIRMLPILADELQEEMLRKELERQGWTREADGSMTKEIDGVKATLSPDASKVTLEVGGKKTVSASATVEDSVEEENSSTRAAVESKAERAAREKLEDAKERARAELVKKNAQRILEVEPTIKREVDTATREATRQALTQKAQELGSITSSTEKDNEAGYELRIEVRS